MEFKGIVIGSVLFVPGYYDPLNAVNTVKALYLRGVMVWPDDADMAMFAKGTLCCYGRHYRTGYELLYTWTERLHGDEDPELNFARGRFKHY